MASMADVRRLDRPGIRCAGWTWRRGRATRKRTQGESIASVPAPASTSSKPIRTSTPRSREVRDEAGSVVLRVWPRHEPVSGAHIRAVRGLRSSVPRAGDVSKLAGPAARLHLDQLAELFPRARREL